MKRIGEFEALRGILALWVVIGHVLHISGLPLEESGPILLLAEPTYAVQVFIILSGFVIFNLLDQTNEGYATFIAQRFFRLYPLYFSVLAISIAFSTKYENWLLHLPWQTDYIRSNAAIATATTQHLVTHALVHLTMLHGLIPPELLQFSECAVIVQAWSISVEWQFYLVAPLLMWLSKNSPLRLAMAILALLVIFSRYWLGQGFAINQAGYFLIGILSYYTYKISSSSKFHSDHIWLGASVALALAVLFLHRPVSLVVWIVFFAAAVFEKLSVSNPVTKISETRFFQWLGKISYSVYLTHMLTLMIASTLLLQLAPNLSQLVHTAILLPATVAGTLAVSMLTFIAIERPGIQFGRRVSEKIRHLKLI